MKNMINVGNTGGANLANQLVKVGTAVMPAVTRVLTPAQYGDLAEVPPELEWLANITNRKTREAYRIDVQEFSTFAGLRGHAEFRTVTRAYMSSPGASSSRPAT